MYGYDDGGFRLKIVHFPLKHLLSLNRERRNLRNFTEYGKKSSSDGGIRWPYSMTTSHGRKLSF